MNIRNVLGQGRTVTEQVEENVQKAFHNTNATMSKFNEDTKNITTIVKAMYSIAEQTNLLALTLPHHLMKRKLLGQ